MPDSFAPATRPALAKINLCLSVGTPQPAGAIHQGKDVSGFHRIATWMACVELHDDVTITRKPEGTPTTFKIAWASDAPRPTPLDWPAARDLARRAHGELEKKIGRPLPADISVTKRIPVGGGFGGGSSDAATTLLLLNDLFELDLSPDELREIAFSLGSDAAFFIDGPDPDADPDDETGSDDDEAESAEPDDSFTPPSNPRSALVSSFGETIEGADPVDAAVILVIPPFSCATRDVYRAFDELQAIRVEAKRAGIAAQKGQEAADLYQAQDARDDLIAKRIEKSLRAGTLDTDSLFNDLFLPAVHVEPRVGRLITALSKGTRTPAHLTGSGSGVFLLAEPKKADKLLAKVRKTLDSLASAADDTPSASLANETFVAIATRLL